MEKGQRSLLYVAGPSAIYFQASDQEEFHRLFVQSQRRIFGYILTLLPRLTDAEEVFQQTCVIVLGKAAQFTPGTDFVGWACQIAQYEVYNYPSAAARRATRSDDALLKTESPACPAQNADLLEEELDALRRCVEKISPSDRHLIQKQYRRRVTSQALAAELGRPANSVYKAIWRIRRKWRECVERSCGEANDKSAPPFKKDQP